MGNQLRPMLGFVKYWLEANGQPYDVTYIDSYMLTMLLELAIAATTLFACYIPLGVANCALSARPRKPGEAGRERDRVSEGIVMRALHGMSFLVETVFFWGACLCLCGMVMLLSAFRKIHVVISGLLIGLILLLSLLHWNRDSRAAMDVVGTLITQEEKRSLLVNNSAYRRQAAWWEEDYDAPATPVQHPKPSLAVRIFNLPQIYVKSIFLGVKLHWARLLICLPLLVVVAVMLPWTTCDLCIAYHPQVISTRFTRQFFKDDNARVCQPETVCHSYTTLAEDFTSGVIFNFQVRSGSVQSAHVLFGTHNVSTSIADDTRLANATCIELRELEQSRVQCWADLEQLQHNTTYYGMAVVVHNDGHETRAQKVLKFRTAPLASDTSDDNDVIRFVDGGDLSWSKSGFLLARKAAAMDPLFIIISGDIAYENGISPCYQRFDEWFAYWNEVMVTPDGYDIPILVSVGNHEAGNFKQPRSNNYFHLRYFPHHMGIKNETAMLERDMFQSHVIGAEAIVLIMDTWTHTSPQDQSEWLDSSLQHHADKRWKIASYHTAAYPPSFGNYFDIAMDIKEAWVPLFDKHGLTVAFEHHYHTYKKSYCLREDKRRDPKKESCTWYLGDGAFGLKVKRKFAKQPDILEYASSMPHVWFTELSSKGPMDIFAIGYDSKNKTIIPNVTGSSITMEF